LIVVADAVIDSFASNYLLLVPVLRRRAKSCVWPKRQKAGRTPRRWRVIQRSSWTRSVYLKWI